jgi:putative hydrolase of the HAD superfamily
MRPEPQSQPPVEAVTLDVGNTLIFPHPSLGTVYAGVGRRHALDLVADEVEQRFEHAWRECQARQPGLVYGTSHASALAFWCQVNRQVLAGAGLSDAQLQALVGDLYVTFGRARAWRVNPGLAVLLDGCRSRGLRIGIISNWDLRLRPLLEDLGIARWADPVLISAEAGWEKPAPQLFRLALGALGVPAERVLHIGDTWSEDVLGATGCGMQAAWLNPSGRAPPAGAPYIHDLRRLEDAARLLAGSC